MPTSWPTLKRPSGFEPPLAVELGELTSAQDHLFTFKELWPYISSAAEAYGADAQVLAAIILQESGWKNWRVHADGTGHGLLGLDDNGLLPDFERWSGLKVGRGASAAMIPPKAQIGYGAYQLRRYMDIYGGAYTAARVWHRGPGLYLDARGDNYEALMRSHVRTLFG